MIKIQKIKIGFKWQNLVLTNMYQYKLILTETNRRVRK